MKLRFFLLLIGFKLKRTRNSAPQLIASRALQLNQNGNEDEHSGQVPAPIFASEIGGLSSKNELTDNPSSFSELIDILNTDELIDASRINLKIVSLSCFV